MNALMKAQINKFKNKLSDDEASYFVLGSISNQIYQLKKQKINILHKNGKVKDLGSTSDQFNSMVNNKPVVKYFNVTQKQFITHFFYFCH